MLLTNLRITAPRFVVNHYCVFINCPMH